jgi:hypothetical protein
MSQKPLSYQVIELYHERGWTDGLPAVPPTEKQVREAITDPGHKFNHMASLGSPWPMFVVNGPPARDLHFNAGLYLERRETSVVFVTHDPQQARGAGGLGFECVGS